MAVWLVRAGKRGEREQIALDNGLALIGWDELPDLSNIQSQEEMKSLFDLVYPDEKEKTVANWVGQVWSFFRRIQPGDLIVLPLKSQSAIAIGKCTGPYQYRPDLQEGAYHTRPVEWIRKEIPRSAFDQDILYSFGAFLTVGRIKRNNAEERIRAVLEGRQPVAVSPSAEEDENDDDILPLSNLEQYARDQIAKHIAQKFKGDDLSNLVAALLEVQGYQTQTSQPGADGGVDIIAGRGTMGFDRPWLCVQVKSSEQPVDVKILRELQGVLKNFGAEQGLLVSWGGFKQSVLREARRLFFEIRLWDAGELVDMLLQNYDKLPEDLQAEIPLKRIWTLVLEDET